MLVIPDTDPYPWPWNGELDPTRLCLLVAGAQRVHAEASPTAHRVAEVIDGRGPGAPSTAGPRSAMSDTPHRPARSVGRPRPLLPKLGDEGWAPVLRPHHDDLVVTAVGHDGFCGSGLDLELRARGVTMLVAVGMAAEVAVSCTRPQRERPRLRVPDVDRRRSAARRRDRSSRAAQHHDVRRHLRCRRHQRRAARRPRAPRRACGARRLTDHTMTARPRPPRGHHDHRRRRPVPLALRRRRSIPPARRSSTSTGRPTSAVRAATSTRMGYDLGLTRAGLEPDREGARRRPRRRMARDPHPRGPSPRPVGLPAEQAVALASASAPASATRAAAAGSWCAASPAGTSCPRSYPLDGRAGHRQARQGRVLRHRPGPGAAHARASPTSC